MQGFEPFDPVIKRVLTTAMTIDAKFIGTTGLASRLGTGNKDWEEIYQWNGKPTD